MIGKVHRLGLSNRTAAQPAKPMKEKEKSEKVTVKADATAEAASSSPSPSRAPSGGSVAR